ncbi:hypothetical protein PHYBOEH_005554 [Phytophthora boehmeriae]|uniref:RxLR effector protein n=1 Tax=Phytophthora boehmeriae TaxID=109152 RepID=A0A8T1WQV6_9STRA|nr:hypothetical protein PHYBOEH_005554 [Phytophthora boehmeriae]
MRINFFLFAAATVLFVESGSVSAVSDEGHTALSTKDSVSIIHAKSGVNRFLRTTETVNDEEAGSEYDSDDDTEGEERNIHELIRSSSFKTLDKLAEELAGVPGVVKYFKQQNDELFKAIAAKKWTPEAMKTELGIAAKIANTPKDRLKYDADYLLYRAYEKFWNARRAQA